MQIPLIIKHEDLILEPLAPPEESTDQIIKRLKSIFKGTIINLLAQLLVKNDEQSTPKSSY